MCHELIPHAPVALGFGFKISRQQKTQNKKNKMMNKKRGVRSFIYFLAHL